MIYVGDRQAINAHRSARYQPKEFCLWMSKRAGSVLHQAYRIDIPGKEAAVTDFDLESLSIPELERLRDAINQRLLQLRYSTPRSLPELLRMLEEVKVVLSDQGKEWRSLERWQWMDGQIRFWLNPADQVHYRPGWYTIDELILWSQDRGPVLVPQEEEEEELESWTEINGVRIRWLPDGTMERIEG